MWGLHKSIKIKFSLLFMLIQFIVAVAVGVIAGTFTGLIPGIHINLIGVFLVSLSATIFSSVNPTYLAVFIVSMAITHTFLDFIPSIFLGCPDTDTELSVLPGHELLKKGFGYEAVILTSYGSLMAIFTLILISFPFILIVDKIYNFLKLEYVTATVLITASVFLIASEKKKLPSLFVFLLSGFLGFCVLNSGINQPLLPLLTGLFGSSMLIISIRNKIKIPEQKLIINNEGLKKPILKAFIGSLIASPMCSFLPGLGSGQAAIIGNTISRTNQRGFLILLGATNTLVMGFSFITLYTISKTRTGAAVAIKEILSKISTEIFFYLISAVILTGIISFFLTKFLAKVFSQKMEKLNYTMLSIITLIILVIIVFLISGISGLAVLGVSTFTGIYCISLKVRRTNMMGCLLIPKIILYLF